MVMSKQGKPVSRWFEPYMAVEKAQDDRETAQARCCFCGATIITTWGRLRANEVWHYCRRDDDESTNGG